MTLWCSGCLSIPGTPSSENPQVQEINTTLIEEPISFENISNDSFPLSPEPTPIQTPVTSTVSDWNPYEVVPLPESTPARPSVLKNNNSNDRQKLNTSCSGTVSLSGYAIGKEMNITKGPFSLTYSVHPKVNNPILAWVKLTILDPWQHVIAEGGYNHEFSSEATKSVTLYQEGRFFLIFEGDFTTVDYTLKTADPTPVPTPTTESYEEEDD